MQSKMIFQQAKQVDLVTLLARLGFMATAVKQQDYWYLSPFRDEHTASFKVNRTRNIWYDHGEGKGGNVIDFAIRFFRCDRQEAAGKILALSGQLDFSFHQQQGTPQQAGEKKEGDRGKILVTGTGPLQSTQRLAYLEERKIPPTIANAFCKEVNFSLYDKRHTACVCSKDFRQYQGTDGGPLSRGLFCLKNLLLLSFD